MNKISELLKDIAKDPGAYIALFVLVVLVVGAVYVIGTSSAENWRHMYCTANEAQAIECAAKGWR
mgnify:FL=1